MFVKEFEIPKETQFAKRLKLHNFARAFKVYFSFPNVGFEHIFAY